MLLLTQRYHMHTDAMRGCYVTPAFVYLSQDARQELLVAVHMLLLMHNANLKAGGRVPANEFYNVDLSESAALQHEYVLWMQSRVLIFNFSSVFGLYGLTSSCHVFSGVHCSFVIPLVPE